jgi:hypothetical protein
VTWLHDFLLTGAPVVGVFIGGWLTRASNNQQWRRDRRLEAYADVLRWSQSLNNEASRLFLRIADDHTSQLQLVHENLLQLYNALNRTCLLATPEMQETCKELSAMFGRISVKAGECPLQMSRDEWRTLAGHEAGILVARFTLLAQNDLRVDARIGSKLAALWRHLTQRRR